MPSGSFPASSVPAASTGEPAPPATAELRGRWLANLLREIRDADYCFVCENHPSHGHNPACPIKEAIGE